jgi:hypothetical protein
MNLKWLTGLSIVGVLIGVGLFLDGFIFSIWGCFCAATGACLCQAPFSYYLYTYYIPFAIIGVSLTVLIWSLRLRKSQVTIAPL